MTKELKAIVKKIDGKLIAIASTENEDRTGDVVKAEGWNLVNFKKNPVLLFAHKYNEPPIGIAGDIRIEGKKLVFEPVFHEITQLAREVKSMYMSDPPIMSAFSVGFIPKKVNEEDPHIIEKQELLEISAVPVPANAQALTLASKSYNTEEEREVNKWLEKEIKEKENDIKDNDKEKDISNIEFVEKPYPNEHACRLKSPDGYDKFARKNCAVKSNEKCIDFIFGIKENKSELQSMRYDKDDWSESEAKSHCDSKDGKFEPAIKKELDKVEEKAGRVISGKNRKIIEDTISSLKLATSTLKDLLSVTEQPSESRESRSHKGRKEVAQKPRKNRVTVQVLQKISKDVSNLLHDIK